MTLLPQYTHMNILGTRKLEEDEQTNRQTDKQTNRQTDKQTNRQTDKQTNRQKDKIRSIKPCRGRKVKKDARTENKSSNENKQKEKEKGTLIRQTKRQKDREMAIHLLLLCKF